MKSFFTYLLIVLTLLTSCSKEFSEQFYAYENNSINDTAWRNSVTANAPVNQITNGLIENRTIFTDSFNVNTGAVIVFSDSLKVFFPPNVCVSIAGTTLYGKIKVELTQLRKKGDFIRYAKPTTSINRLLQTGGSFNVRLSQNGFPLNLAPNASYKIVYRNPFPSNDMLFFYEETIASSFQDTIKTWMPSDNLGTVTNWQQYDTATNTVYRGYEITSKKLNWINCDFFNDTTQPATKVNVSLPLNFTNNNTQVYMVFKSKNIIARLLGEPANRLFTFPKVPVNSEVYLIAIGKLGNDFYFGSKSINIVNANIISTQLEPKPLNFINNYLDNL
jgi:hypothetical protein